MIEKGSIYAIIPARAGSKGVKNKNIRCVKGYPLLAYAIAAAKNCEYVSRIIVSTDSEEYAKIARYYGAETPFLRPAKFATDTSPDIEFMEHAIGWLEENEGKLPAHLTFSIAALMAFYTGTEIRDKALNGDFFVLRLRWNGPGVCRRI